MALITEPWAQEFDLNSHQSMNILVRKERPGPPGRTRLCLTSSWNGEDPSKVEVFLPFFK
jgi:hypothetical protein